MAHETASSVLAETFGLALLLRLNLVPLGNAGF